MLLENSKVQVSFLGLHISCMYPCVFPVAGSSTPWKATSSSPMDSTVWFSHVYERRGYL